MVPQKCLGLVRWYKYEFCVFYSKALPRRRVSVAVVPKFQNISGQALTTGGSSLGLGDGLGTAAGLSPGSGPGALPVLVSSILIKFFCLTAKWPFILLCLLGD